MLEHWLSDVGVGLAEFAVVMLVFAIGLFVMVFRRQRGL